jgi:hypothetical protein
MKRRDALLTTLFGTGYVGLRALATGLPAWFIANPRRATAQNLSCAITAKTTMQYLILSTNFNGDPINCNCPGTYEDATIIHPTQEEVEQTTVSVGGQSLGAALPWNATTATSKAGNNTGQLKAMSQLGGQTILSRTSFFHHMTGSTVHGDQPKVMKLMGKTAGNEMIISAYAKFLAPCFGTVQAEPIALGAGQNGSEILTYSGRALTSVSPTQLKQLLTGSKTDPLVKLRTIRDTTIDQLNQLAKSDGNMAQKAFLDAMALSQTQVRALSSSLATTLNSISSDNVAGQAAAAAALFSANVTPAVSVRLAFGGDNHSDSNLQNEADQHVSGVQGLQAIMDALAAQPDPNGTTLLDRVTFATLNVFGRNLNGISKTTSRAGRDHYGNHAVMVMVGKNVKSSVIGGVTTVSGAGQASAIDSTTGKPTTASGATVIPNTMTHVAAARTLGVALGIPSGTLDAAFISSAATGKVVNAALSGVSG